jgi:DNA-binding transcriptional LysR family regulator
LDWDHLRTFLFIARRGSLSGAARELAVSQTTVARRLAALEEEAGSKLFDRRTEGFGLTQAGERILALVEEMEAQALAAERAITGQDARLNGLVRITTADIFAAWFIAPALVPLQELHPNIAIELLTPPRALSLARREADIAIRIGEFEQRDIIVKRVAHMAWGLYASERYLARHGEPDWSTGAAGHFVVASQQDRADRPEAIWLRKIAAAATPYLFANSWSVQLSACKEGLGFAWLPRYAADADPTLRLLCPPDAPPGRDVWLGVHRDLRDTPRIREVIHLLTAALKEQSKQISGERMSTAPVDRSSSGLDERLAGAV